MVADNSYLVIVLFKEAVSQDFIDDTALSVRISIGSKNKFNMRSALLPVRSEKLDQSIDDIFLNGEHSFTLASGSESPDIILNELYSALHEAALSKLGAV